MQDFPDKAYELFHRLCAVMGDPVLVGQWYREPNEAFGGRSPNTVIVDGEIDLLWQMLYQLEGNPAA